MIPGTLSGVFSSEINKQQQDDTALDEDPTGSKANPLPGAQSLPQPGAPTPPLQGHFYYTSW